MPENIIKDLFIESLIDLVLLLAIPLIFVMACSWQLWEMFWLERR